MTKLQWQHHIKGIDEAQAILEKKYLNLKHEQAYIAFPFGKIAKVQGGLDSIESSEENLGISLKNAHMIHNHPAGPPGSPIGLSGYDVGFAVSVNLESIAVLDEGIGIRLWRPQTGWPPADMILRWIPNKLTWEEWGAIEQWKTE